MPGHLHDSSCIFCKIVRGEIPSTKILETDHALVFMDINPVNQGHLLVVPKGHAPTLAELSEDQAAHVGSLLPGLCRSVKAATNADGFNLVVNGGIVAGQTVDHCHYHIIPRFEGDAVHWPWPHVGYGEGELAQLCHRIKRELNRPNQDGLSAL